MNRRQSVTPVFVILAFVALVGLLAFALSRRPVAAATPTVTPTPSIRGVVPWTPTPSPRATVIVNTPGPTSTAVPVPPTATPTVDTDPILVVGDTPVRKLPQAGGGGGA